MSGVLAQDEINTLLAAAAQSDAAAIAAGANDGRVPIIGAEEPQEVSLYDFKRPERVSKDHIRALASIHDGFARNFGASLSGFLRTIIDVRVVGVEQLTYSEFIYSLPNPTCFIILQAPPLEGQMCMEISPLIVYPIIDRLLGGSSAEVYIPQRPLTAIEWRLMGRIVTSALSHLSEIWKTLVDAKFDAVETESNPQLVHIVAPSEVVVFITFEIKMGTCAGTMSMCIPFNTIETVLGKLTTQSWFGYRQKGGSDAHKQRMLRSLHRSTVELRAMLGAARVHVGEYRTMKIGDIIPVHKAVGEELILQVGGRNKFAAQPGQLRGKRALRLTRVAEPDEDI
jgi:flagellar motor switch protein FliM